MAFHIGKHQDQDHEGIISRVAQELVEVYDWLSGPGLSNRERVQRAIFESRHLKHLDPRI